MKQLIKENEPPFRNRKFRVSPGNHYFVRVCTFPAVLRFFGNFRFFLVRRELLDPSHRNPPPPPFPNRRMRRESLAQVTLLLKTMKQTLYERGYGANYLAISRPSNKWASPPTSLSLSLFLSLSLLSTHPFFVFCSDHLLVHVFPSIVRPSSRCSRDRSSILCASWKFKFKDLERLKGISLLRLNKIEFCLLKEFSMIFRRRDVFVYGFPLRFF